MAIGVLPADLAASSAREVRRISSCASGVSAAPPSAQDSAIQSVGWMSKPFTRKGRSSASRRRRLASAFCASSSTSRANSSSPMRAGAQAGGKAEARREASACSTTSAPAGPSASFSRRRRARSAQISRTPPGAFSRASTCARKAARLRSAVRPSRPFCIERSAAETIPVAPPFSSRAPRKTRRSSPSGWRSLISCTISSPGAPGCISAAALAWSQGAARARRAAGAQSGASGESPSACTAPQRCRRPVAGSQRHVASSAAPSASSTPVRAVPNPGWFSRAIRSPSKTRRPATGPIAGQSAPGSSPISPNIR
jgi:hypothetical protein